MSQTTSEKRESRNIVILDDRVAAEQVIGLIESVADMNPEPVDAARLSAYSGAGADILAILGTAEMLGLAANDRERVSVTALGLELARASNYKGKIMMLKDQLAKIEPIRTTLTLTSVHGITSVREIAKTLQDLGVRWDPDDETNESKIESILVDWGVQAELLERDKNGRFVNPSVKIMSARERRTEARNQLRKSAAEARKKYTEARRDAWKAYKAQLALARKAHKEAIAAARDDTNKKKSK